MCLVLLVLTLNHSKEFKASGYTLLLHHQYLAFGGATNEPNIIHICPGSCCLVDLMDGEATVDSFSVAEMFIISNEATVAPCLKGKCGSGMQGTNAICMHACGSYHT